MGSKTLSIGVARAYQLAAYRKRSDNFFDQVLFAEEDRLNGGESLLPSDLGCVFFSISCRV